MNIFPFAIASQWSFKRQIILTFAGGFFLLMTAFAAYQVKVETANLYRNSTIKTTALANSLAISSRSWILANDLAGLQEVVHAFQGHQELRYAMIVAPSGRVLAHTDAARIGQFLSDAPSLTLIQTSPHNRVMIDNPSVIDVAVPIMIETRQIGWARIGFGREDIAKNLHTMILNYAIFLLIALALALLAAILVASRLGKRIGSLMQVAKEVRAGNFDMRASISGREDEITSLADSLNQMLDTLAQNEKELRSASLYTRSLIEASLDPLVTISPDGKITDVNKATEKVTGRDRSELIGTDFSNYFTDPDKARKGYRQGFIEGVVTDYALAIRHQDGHITEVLYNASVYRDEAGKVLGVFAAARDITEHKQAEATRTQLAAIVESSNDAIISKTPDGIITSWNKSAEKIYGYAAVEVIGKPVTVLAPPSRHNEINTLLEKIRNGQTVVNHESERIRKDGTLIHVELTLSPIKDATGNITGISTIARDITARKHNEEELRRYRDHFEEEVQQRTADLVLARNAAEAANQAKSVFLASMSHELRTPLNAILGFSNIMRKDPLLQESQRQNLNIINRSGEHLLTLINDVLEMAKIESGRVQLEEAPFDLGNMVRDVTEMMEFRAKEKNLRLLIDQSSRFPRYIIGDEARLRQVLINLLGNAVKFTQQGGVTVRLGTKSNAISHLEIEVEDSGSGIPLEDQQRIFEPFVQLSSQGGSKGTGLGLTITRQFVHLMGGTIQLESILGKGSIFRIELPLKEASEDSIIKANPAESGEVVALAPGQPEYRILIAEDQRDNQLLLAKLMEAIGIQSRIAENGEQAVQLFQDWHPHFIWMDRRMPVMDGLEAMKAIRQLPGGAEVKIVAVTASAFQEQRAELLNAGMDDFVRKPYRSNEIYECLSKQLGIRYIYQGIPQPENPVTLTPEMLNVLPDTLRHDLQAALESLENESIALAIRQVASFDPQLQKTLTILAENYDYPAILRALQKNP